MNKTTTRGPAASKQARSNPSPTTLPPPFDKIDNGIIKPAFYLLYPDLHRVEECRARLRNVDYVMQGMRKMLSLVPPDAPLMTGAQWNALLEPVVEDVHAALDELNGVNTVQAQLGLPG